MKRVSVRRAGLAAVAAAVLGVLPLGCGGGNAGWPADRPGPKILVSFGPIYCWAVNVAGEDAAVKTLMTNTGPHDFNPTDTDARLARGADILFINGLGLDNAVAAKVRDGSGNQKLKIVELGATIPEGELLEGVCHHDHKDQDHPHDHGKDPHLWLNPDFAVRMTETIRDELVRADPERAERYKLRADKYTKFLAGIKAAGHRQLKNKTDRKLISFHDSLAYFAKAFDLKVEGVVQTKPGQEPNVDELKQLVRMCREKQVRLIAVEPQYGTQTSAKAVLDELRRGNAVPDAALVEIDTLETVTPDALTPAWYYERMLANVAALAGAMK